MAEQDERDQWTADAEAVFAEVRAWRTDHPSATWVEIQDAVEGGIRRLRERMVTDTAHSSSLADFAHAEEGPTCPECGVPLQANGKKTRTLQLKQGGTVSLERTRGVCPGCKAGLFPPG